MTYPPQYSAPTNQSSIPAVLGADQSQWILFYPSWLISSPISPGDYPEVGISADESDQNWLMASGTRNLFGLTYVSALLAQDSQTVSLLNAGSSIPIASGKVYLQTAQPLFQTVEYDFWRANVDWLPGRSNFSPTNSPPLLVASVGSKMQVAGYAKLAITNGYAGMFAYLGQYFTNACKIDANGNVTTNTTGILSPYGEFFPTEPGPTALRTMPDLDTGQQGSGVVYVIKLVLDKNHDGTMDGSFSGQDNTSQASPDEIWANNNFDRWATNTVLYGYLYTDIEQDDQQIACSPAAPNTPTPDCNYSNMLANGYAYRAIPCTRDLEDFARLWVCGITTNLLAQLPSGSTVTLSWGDVGNPNSGNPTIDLFTAADANGGIGYQTNETVATAQINAIQCPYIGRLGPGGNIQLNASQFANQWAGNYFIWCGVSNGTGGLTLTITDGNSNTLAQTTAYIQIVDIKQMYQRWTVGDNSNTNPLTAPILASENLPPGVPSFEYPPPQNTNTPYILHVHGFNMQTWEKDRYAETEFKRLYWQGYQGRFGEFRWPTTIQGLANFNTAFDDSEFNAWQSAKGLLNLLTNLDAEYPGNVYLTAHSHGNVVAGEALRLAGNNQVVNTYIAMQGAVASHAYDPTTPIRLLNSTGVNLDQGTPDYYAQYYTPGALCYFNGSAGAGTYINFFNTNDWALTTLWRPDQDLKPDTGQGYGWNGTNFYQGLIYPVYQLFPIDTYPIFAYCDPARCQALGAQANVGGAFAAGSQTDLHSVWPPDTYVGSTNYTTHVWHSAEFRSDNPNRAVFWNTVLGPNGFNLK